MEYLHLFETQAAHDAVYNGDGYHEPWVALVEQNNKVTYNKTFAKQYLTFEDVSGEEWDFLSFTIPEEVGTEYVQSISYSVDEGDTWITVENEDNNQVIIMIDEAPINNKVLFKGNASQLAWSEGGPEDTYHCHFHCAQSFNVYGNIMSLFYNDAFVDNTEFQNNSNWNCNMLFCHYDDNIGDFGGCSIVNAKNLVLPAEILTDGCYSAMFVGCESLIIPPKLLALSLNNYCYSIMFSGCTSLTTVPELPAKTLADACYDGMFNGCTSLTTAPELPATTLARNCYSGMFKGCTSLTTAPELPATALTGYCYSAMFSGCTKLNYVKAMFTTTPSDTYTGNWVSGVASTGTFVKNSAATWNVTGDNGIPTGWTVETAST